MDFDADRLREVESALKRILLPPPYAHLTARDQPGPTPSHGA
jgi:hypothetical protein